jgi:hypothetical protein
MKLFSDFRDFINWAISPEGRLKSHIPDGTAPGLQTAVDVGVVHAMTHDKDVTTIKIGLQGMSDRGCE